MIVHEPSMNWQIEKHYFPSFKPLVDTLRVYSTKSSSGQHRSGKAFRVPPEFSGTPLNNFIHKLFDGRDKELGLILRKFLAS